MIRANAEDVFISVPRFEQAVYRGLLDTSRRLVLQLLAITASTWSDTISVTLTGRDADLFTVAFTTKDDIKVELRRALTDSDVAGKQVLLVTVVGSVPDVDSGRTAIVVEVPDSLNTSPETPTIKFEKSVYLGQLNSIDLDLTAQEILLINTSRTNVDLSMVDIVLTGGDSDFFALDKTANPIRLLMAPTLSALDLQYRDFLMTTVIVTGGDVTGVESATLIVNILNVGIAKPTPRFERNLYTGRIDDQNVLLVDTVKLVANTYTSDLRFSIMGTDMFAFSVERNELTLRLNRLVTDEDRAKYVVTGTIWALGKDGAPSGSTELIVTLPVSSSNPTTPHFEEFVYMGRIDRDYVLSVPTIVVSLQTATDVVTFTLQGDDMELFSITSEGNIVTVALRRPLTDADVEGKSYLKFSIDAVINLQNKITAIILINIPTIDNQEPQVPEFEELMYTGQLDSDRKLQLEPVLLKSVTYSADLEFTLSGSDDSLFQIEQNFHTITITLRRELNDADVIGRTYFSMVLVATNPGVGVASTAIIVQLARVMCPPDPSQHVTDALLIKYLVENHIHSDIMPGTIDNCEFVVISTVPNNAVYVRNDPNTHRITSIEFDREATAFEYMAVPQIEVQLELVCDTDAVNIESLLSNGTLSGDLESFYRRETASITSTSADPTYLNPMASDGRTYVLTKSLTYAPRRTQLTIIIEDENDNAPQFVQPLTDHQLYGYPTGRLAELIMPKYLVKVRAIDADAGFNASIRYALDTNSLFQIDGKTGAVTPMRSTTIAKEPLELTVHATDRDGATDGLSTNRVLLVRALYVEHIVVISMWSVTSENAEQEDEEHFVDRVFDTIGLELSVLHAARIQVEDLAPEGMSQNEIPLNLLRMYVYASNSSATDGVMSASDVQRSLSDIDSSSNTTRLSSRTMAEHLDDLATTVSNGDQFGLTVACAVLAVLLLLTSVGTFLLWWFKIRPYEYRQVMLFGESKDGTDSESVASHRHLVMMSDKRAAALTVQDSVLPPIAAESTEIVPSNEIWAISGSTTNGKKTNDLEVGFTDSYMYQAYVCVSFDLTSVAISPTETADDSKSLQSQLSRVLFDRLNRLDDIEKTNTASNLPSPTPPPPPPPLPPPPPPPRTGVKFNELVERIDILVQPDIDDKTKSE